MDNDFPVRMAGGKLGSYLQQYSSGVNKYSQGGTAIPDFTTQSSYANEAGGPFIGMNIASHGYSPAPADYAPINTKLKIPTSGQIQSEQQKLNRLLNPAILRGA